MKVELDLRWNLGVDTAAPLDESLFELLAGIQETGSLQKACRRAGVSYRHAWGLLAASATALGKPLAELSRGRGSQLAPLGSALLAARARVESRLAPELAQIAHELAQELASPAPATARRWRVFASHDLALLNAREALSHACGVDLELETHGSDECLEALARRRCNVAGFHISGDESPAACLRDSLVRAADRPIRLVEFAKREQGLMLRAGLETKIHTLAELARSGARFVNRQRGSGTRTLFDRLLKAENSAPSTSAAIRTRNLPIWPSPQPSPAAAPTPVSAFAPRQCSSACRLCGWNVKRTTLPAAKTGRTPGTSRAWWHFSGARNSRQCAPHCPATTQHTRAATHYSVRARPPAIARPRAVTTPRHIRLAP